MNIRAQVLQKTFHVGFSEEHDVVHAAKRGNELGASVFIEDWAAGPLEVADAGIGIHADNKNVTFAARTFKITNMSDVQRIKTAVGKDDALAMALVFREFHAQQVSRNDFGSSLAHNL